MGWFKRPSSDKQDTGRKHKTAPGSPHGTTQAAHLKAGVAAEQLAEHYLNRQGLRCLARNYRCRGGELDRVMYDGRTLIFVEIRHRRRGNYGGALASVTLSKRRRLIRAASEYLLRERVDSHCPCRFDVVAVEGELSQPQFHWIRHAFELDPTGA